MTQTNHFALASRTLRVVGLFIGFWCLANSIGMATTVASASAQGELAKWLRVSSAVVIELMVVFLTVLVALQFRGPKLGSRIGGTLLLIPLLAFSGYSVKNGTVFLVIEAKPILESKASDREPTSFQQPRLSNRQLPRPSGRGGNSKDGKQSSRAIDAVGEKRPLETVDLSKALTPRAVTEQSQLFGAEEATGALYEGLATALLLTVGKFFGFSWAVFTFCSLGGQRTRTTHPAGQVEVGHDLITSSQIASSPLQTTVIGDVNEPVLRPARRDDSKRVLPRQVKAAPNYPPKQTQTNATAQVSSSTEGAISDDHRVGRSSRFMIIAFAIAVSQAIALFSVSGSSAIQSPNVVGALDSRSGVQRSPVFHLEGNILEVANKPSLPCSGCRERPMSIPQSHFVAHQIICAQSLPNRRVYSPPSLWADAP